MIQNGLGLAEPEIDRILTKISEKSMTVGSEPALTLMKKMALLEKIFVIVLEERSLKLLPKSISKSEDVTVNHYN